MNDILQNKMQTIKRCIERIRNEYADNPVNLSNMTKQDAIILNIQRACEACIDLAMHIVSVRNLGLPQNSRDAFELLKEGQIIDERLCSSLKSMVGFRNIAVHDYQALNMTIVQAVIEHKLQDIIDYVEILIKSDIN